MVTNYNGNDDDGNSNAGGDVGAMKIGIRNKNRTPLSPLARAC